MIEEVHELEDTIRQLELKSELSEDRLRDLQHTRLALEKEINTKRNTISYDRGQFKSFCRVNQNKTKETTASKLHQQKLKSHFQPKIFFVKFP